MEDAINREKQNVFSPLYGGQWRAYRRLRIWAVVITVFAFPALLAVMALTNDSNTGALVDIGAFLMLVGLIYYLCIRWVYWPCPRCKHAFRGRRLFFPERCQNCALEKPPGILRW